MKIKLSKNQWEQIGKTAGWIKKAFDLPENADAIRSKRFQEYDKTMNSNVPVGMAPEDTGHHDDNISRKRVVEVTFNNGDKIRTEINGTVENITKYYLPCGNRGEVQDYDENDPWKVRWPVQVDFIQ